MNTCTVGCTSPTYVNGMAAAAIAVGGEIVLFDCNAGYVGAVSATCQNDGTFDVAAPTCVIGLFVSFVSDVPY